jgi:hypothetical protein
MRASRLRRLFGVVIFACLTPAASASDNQSPVARCHNVVIDATVSCPASFAVTPDQVNNGSSDAEDGANVILQLFFPGDIPVPPNFQFPLGDTNVILRVTDRYVVPGSDSCNAIVTVRGNDCNNNRIPDSCDIALGTSADCGGNGIPDECECFWDNNFTAILPPSRSGSTFEPSLNGQLSHLGGAVPRGEKAADDFYLEPCKVHRITSFSATMLTNAIPQFRRARLEFYRDCDGRPDGEPFLVSTDYQIVATANGPAGFTLVTYCFDFCDQHFWLDGGRYWVSIMGYTIDSRRTTDETYWIAADPSSFDVMQSIPVKASGTGGVFPSQQNQMTFDSWVSLDECCLGCVNLNFKLTGYSCDIWWDNGEWAKGQSRVVPVGGLSSRQGEPFRDRAVDNFGTSTCEDADVCYVDAIIHTNCDIEESFFEIYANECREPTELLYTSGRPSAIEQLDTDAVRVGIHWLKTYRVRFEVSDLLLPRNQNYWISAVVPTGTTLSNYARFAFADPCENACNVRISPAQSRTSGTQSSVDEWAAGQHDLAFRIALRPEQPRMVRPPLSQPIFCGADINRSGAVTVQDIYEYLQLYREGCP